MPAKGANQAWHNNLRATAALLPLGPDNRIDSGVMTEGGYKGDSVPIGNSLVKLDAVLYSDYVLNLTELFCTPEEFANRVLKAQVLSVDEAVQDYVNAHPVGQIAFRAPRLLDESHAESVHLRGLPGVTYRWSLVTDDWRQLKSIVDVYAGAEI
ncbi:hypothetical protein [Mycobacteroides chelonae]|uniref:hypothetical protein n=1 Tax=Mycobacteroides chelonae TaxID=1774 RepID=UPI000993DC31|nr:hypothetical protein [Mycobacteroides chelonae]